MVNKCPDFNFSRRRVRPWALVFLGLLIAMVLSAYQFWVPGKDVRDGRDDRGQNGMWLQHGWMADRNWFLRNGGIPRQALFHSQERLIRLKNILQRHGIQDVFPHLAPVDHNGRLPPHDGEQVERLLDALVGMRVMPWVGGVQGRTVHVGDQDWRWHFVRSVRDLFQQHPRLAGIHVNIEPWSNGDPTLLGLLHELKQALPPEKVLSVAAYPPTTLLHPFPEVHWDNNYYRRITAIADQVVVMMYDTALPSAKLYQALLRSWTQQVLSNSQGAAVLLGVPTYDDAGVGYHHPEVENIQTALFGIHAGLAGFAQLPDHYQGLAIYSEWETDDEEWRYWREHFLR